MTDGHIATGMVRAGLMDGALRPRIVGLAESLPGPSWLAVLLETGEGRFSGEDDAVSGPALIWRPWGGASRAVFGAGARGAYVILGTTALANAAGHMPETRELRSAAGRAMTAPLHSGSTTFSATRAAFEGVRAELGSDDAASHAAVESYLRIILIAVYRAGRAESRASEPALAANGFFAEFGALVEAHFRKRWSVNDYARALGLSRDRLGDICRRVRGMGPKQVIDRRATLEARLQLENSSNSIQEIAALLGFSSSAQFSRFFARTMGRPPGNYRNEYLQGVRSGASDPLRPYEWP